MKEGFYWCKPPAGDLHVALYSEGLWWVPGVADPVDIPHSDVLCPIVRPDFASSTVLEADLRIN